MGKKIFFVLLLFAVYIQSSGQVSVTKDRVPPFTILLTNGQYFSYTELQKDKPVMLIYFAPDCDHCRDFIKQLTLGMREFTKTQIILISYFPLAKLQQFNKDFKLAKFSNIKMGTEGNSFLVPKYFKISTFPFTALFNKTGKLTATFRQPPSLEVLSNSLRKN